MQTKISKWTTCQTHTQKYREAPSTWKLLWIIKFCMADELNGQALSVHHTNPYTNYNFQNDGNSRYFGLWLWKLVHLLWTWFVLSCGVIHVVPWQRSIGTGVNLSRKLVMNWSLDWSRIEELLGWYRRAGMVQGPCLPQGDSGPEKFWKQGSWKYIFTRSESDIS